MNGFQLAPTRKLIVNMHQNMLENPYTSRQPRDVRLALSRIVILVKVSAPSFGFFRRIRKTMFMTQAITEMMSDTKNGVTNPKGFSVDSGYAPAKAAKPA